MQTAFSKIVDAMLAVLTAEPMEYDEVYRTHGSVVPGSINKALSVQFEGGMPNRGVIAGAPVDWETRITVDCYSRSRDETGDLSVDPLVADAYARLAADSTLGGLVDDLAIAGVEAENNSDGTKTGWVRLTYIVQHRTDNLTLS